jgi:hypothetical protein
MFALAPTGGFTFDAKQAMRRVVLISTLLPEDKVKGLCIGVSAKHAK